MDSDNSSDSKLPKIVDGIRCGRHHSSSYSQPKKVVSQHQYNEAWIRDTWGWDSPENFVATQGRNIRPRVLASLELAMVKPGMRILDVGCGRGELVMHCARIGAEAIGLDYSCTVIELAEKAKASHTNEEQSRMEFVCEDIKSFKTDRKFDRIFMLDLIEHLQDWELEQLLPLCNRILAPNGFLIIHTLPNKWVYEITYRRLVRLVLPWLPKNPRTEKEMSIHVNEMTIIHLHNLLRRAGFESRVWFQDLIVEQARWHSRNPVSDKRGMVYRWLAKPSVGFIYKLLAKTPLRLLIVNEIFAVAWGSKGKPPLTGPFRLTERLVLLIYRKISNLGKST